MEPSMPPRSLTMIEHAVRSGRVLVVGGGLAGILTAFQVLKAGPESKTPIEVHWAFDNQSDTASYEAGAYFAVFASEDKRCGPWAQRSWTLGPQLFEGLGVAEIPTEIPTLYVSNEWPMPLPPGLPSAPHYLKPSKYGLGGAYDYAALVKKGRVFSPRKLLPAMTGNLEAMPGVFTYKNTHFRDIEDIRRFCNEMDITTVFVCAGAGAGRLLGHVEPEVQGSLGLLIRLKMRESFKFHNDTVVMDEDDDGELSYSIPAPGTGMIGVGGTVQELYEYPYSPGASDVPDHREQRAQIAAQAEEEFEAIRERVMKKFPLLRSALRQATMADAAYALRPYATGVILRVLPTSITGDLIVAEISGLGGSGYTIGPAVTQDALHLLVPTAPSEIVA